VPRTDTVNFLFVSAEAALITDRGRFTARAAP
jgi:hypothetical protein